MNTVIPNIFLVKYSDISGRLDPNYIHKSKIFCNAIIKAKCDFDYFGKSISYIQYGISKLANSEKSGTPILRMSNLQNGDWDYSNLKSIELSENERNLYTLKNGDILFNRTNSKELVGKCGVFKEEVVMVFASYLIRVRVNQEKLLPDFASIFLQLPLGRLQIDGISRQIIGMTNINAEEIKQLLIPSLTIKEQEKAVANMSFAHVAKKTKEAEAQHLLDSIDDYLLQELAIELPEERENSVHERMFFRKFSEVRGGRLDAYCYKTFFRSTIINLKKSKYKTESLRNVTRSIVNGYDCRQYVDSGVMYLRVANVKNNEFDLSDIKYIPSPDTTKDIILKVGDLLLTRKGSFGIAAIVDDATDGAIISSEVFKIVISENSGVDPQYLSIWLNSKIIQIYFDKVKTGAIMGHLSQDALTATPVIIPEINKQQEIAAHFKAIRNQAKQLRQQAVADLEQAKQEVEAMILEGVDQ